MNNSEDLQTEINFIKQRRKENKNASDGLANGLTQEAANELLKTRRTNPEILGWLIQVATGQKRK